MNLYIYNAITGELFETVEAERYDGESVSGAFGTIWVGDEMEFSRKEDLSEKLRSDWRRDNPTLEELVGILLGGEERVHE